MNLQLVYIKFANYNFSIFQDAHELLSMCLDQLKDDVAHIGNDSSHGNTDSKNDTTENSTSPVVMNFESNIDHKIVCKE